MELCNKWVQSIKNENTKRAYTSVVKAMGRYLAKSPHLLTPTDIVKYIEHLSSKINPHTNRPYSDLTINQHISAIKSFIVFINDYIGADLHIPLKKQGELSELQMLKTVISRSTPQGKRDYAILMFLIATNLKIRDLPQISFGDVRHLHNRTVIELEGQINKLSTEVEEALDEYIKERGNTSPASPLFTATLAGKRAIENRGLDISIERPLSHRMINKLLRKYKKKLNRHLLSPQPDEKKFNFPEQDVSTKSKIGDQRDNPDQADVPPMSGSHTSQNYASGRTANSSYSSTPIISDKSVRRALERLRSGSLHRIKPESMPRNTDASDDAVYLLGGLALVARVLEDPHLPHIHPDLLLGYAVDSVLVHHIIHHYTRLRDIFGLSSPDLDANLEECERYIAQDASNKTSSERLLAWSWLYHRYVRAELNISPPLFAKHISKHRRSMHRYRQIALDLLVRSLTEAEESAQQQNRHSLLLAAIPGVPDVTFYGRDHLINWIDTRVASYIPAHFVITGDSGTGKTEFVGAAARRWVSNPVSSRFFEIVWIHNPTTIQGIYYQVYERLNLEPVYVMQNERNILVELRAFLQKYPVLIVIDSLDFLESPSEAANDIITTLGLATICLVSRSNLTINAPVETLFMRDLDETEIMQFCLDKTDLDTDSAKALASELKTKIGGNPLAIKLALDNYSDVYGAVQLTSSDILTRLFHVKFERLEPANQRLWCACALVPDYGITLNDLMDIWPSYAFGGVSILLSQHILRKMPSEIVVLETSAQRYIRTLYDEPDGYVLRRAMDDVIHHLIQAIASGKTSALPIVEHTLRTGWPTVPPEMAQYWFDLTLKRQTPLSRSIIELMEALQLAH